MSDFNRIAEEFSKTRATNWPFVEALVRDNVKPGETVLDLACGNGRLFPLIARAGATYHGLDLSPALIQIATQHHPAGTFAVGNMIQLPYPSHTFDHIFCIAAFHHLKTSEQRTQAFSEMHRVLTPGGTLVLTVWNLYQWRFARYFWKSFLRALKTRTTSVKDVMIPWKHQNGTTLTERYYHAFTESELTDLLERASFTLKTVRRDANLVIIAHAS